MIEIAAALSGVVVALLVYVEWRVRRLLRQIEDQLMPEPTPPARTGSRPTKDDIIAAQARAAARTKS